MTQENTNAIDYWYQKCQKLKSQGWKPADGKDLPKIDREVIVLIEPHYGYYEAAFAHRTQECTKVDDKVYEVLNYGKGGWNQPNVKWWLDFDLPINE